MGVASLVLGILSILASVLSAGLFGSWGVVMGIIGIVLGAMERKAKPQSVPALVGIIVSCIGTLISLLFYMACKGCIGLVF